MAFNSSFVLLMAWLMAQALADDLAPAAAQVPVEASESARIADVPVSKADNDPVVCKRVEVTGSRIRKGRLCKPRSVWENHEKQAESLMKDIERGNSTGARTLDEGGN